MRVRPKILVWAVLALALVPPAGAGAAGTPYTQDIMGPRDGPELDILIVPPLHGPLYNDEGVLDGGDPMQATPLNTYIRAMEDSVQMWLDGARKAGPGWLKKVIRFNVYVLGRDVPPSTALEDPEVIISATEFNGAGGFAVWSSDGSPCLVSNSSFIIKSFTYADMFNVNAQEFGHCLGLGHIQLLGEDANAYEDPVVGHDVMNGLYADDIGGDGTHLHCLSNLNLGGLERVFGISAPAGTRARYPVAVGPAGYRPDVYCPRK